MTRTVALGAIIGFAITIVVLALWERSGSGTPAASGAQVDAGALIFVNPKLERGLLAVPGERRVEKVILAPVPATPEDAGSP